MLRLLTLILALSLGACTTSVPEDTKFVIAGDSMMAWNGRDQNVAAHLQRLLGEPVGSVARSLAQVDGGVGFLSIPNQIAGYAPEWIIVNGGANDLSQNCRCSECGRVLDRLVTSDGATGAIPTLVARLRSRGSKIVWVDYYTSPRYVGTTCLSTYQELEARLSRMVSQMSGVTLVELGETFSPNDLSLFDRDRTHPSPKGSALIAQAVANILRQE